MAIASMSQSICFDTFQRINHLYISPSEDQVEIDKFALEKHMPVIIIATQAHNQAYSTLS